MALLGLDLGGTKLALALLKEDGSVIKRKTAQVKDTRGGTRVGQLIKGQISDVINYSSDSGDEIKAIGISVPGISHAGKGTVWAPNIPGWEDYPLLAEVSSVTKEIPVVIDSDRACCIMGEVWKGNARGCRDAVFLAIGTGIGAGIIINGEILRGSHDIAGAIGWMALSRPFRSLYSGYGCFEYHASGDGIGRIAREYLEGESSYTGKLRKKAVEKITSYDVFDAYAKGDTLGAAVINQCVEFWGMAAANLVSLFNPEKIIFGGGVFGPACSLMPVIKEEAAKWAQPISINQVVFDKSDLEGDAGVIGAGYLALKRLG